MIDSLQNIKEFEDDPIKDLNLEEILSKPMVDLSDEELAIGVREINGGLN